MVLGYPLHLVRSKRSHLTVSREMTPSLLQVHLKQPPSNLSAISAAMYSILLGEPIAMAISPSSAKTLMQPEKAIAV